MMVPVGRLDDPCGPSAKSELIRAMAAVATPWPGWSDAGPDAGGFIVAYFHWRVIFFLNIPIGLDRALAWSIGICRTTAKNPIRSIRIRPDSVWCGRGAACLMSLEGFWRTHAGHTGDSRTAGDLDYFACELRMLHSTKTSLHPAAGTWPVYRIRTFRAAVSGSFFTRLGLEEFPLCSTLLYQVGIGFTPVQSGLLMMPQAIAAMSPESDHAANSAAQFGYRAGDDFKHDHSRHPDLVFRDHWNHYANLADYPAWLFASGFFSSLQYTSMNTLVYADVTEVQTSSASSIASTLQQLSISFGVAVASLVAAFFIPNRFSSDAAQMIEGIHKAFFVLGGLTLVSTVIFRELKSSDGDTASQHKQLAHAE